MQPSLAIQEPPVELTRALISRGDDPVILPAVAREALAIAKDPNCDGRDFAAVIKRDVKLTTEMLALSNCAAFSCGIPAVTIDQAVMRLGFRQCRNLILTTSAANLVHRMTLEAEWVHTLLWQHSITTATACTHLNRALDLGFDGEEFTAGLIHDLGRLLLAVAAPDAYLNTDDCDFLESDRNLDREQEILGTDHCCFGAWFGKYSELPEALTSVMQYHHTPDVEQPHQLLTALVAAGDHLANHLQLYDGGEAYDASQNEGIQVLAQVDGTRDWDHFLESVPQIAEAILTDAQQSLEQGGRR